MTHRLAMDLPERALHAMVEARLRAELRAHPQPLLTPALRTVVVEVVTTTLLRLGPGAVADALAGARGPEEEPAASVRKGR
jgi:hypothetical protein